LFYKAFFLAYLASFRNVVYRAKIVMPTPAVTPTVAPITVPIGPPTKVPIAAPASAAGTIVAI
jgi:hypothetical protein